MLYQMKFTYVGTPDLLLADKKSITGKGMELMLLEWHRKTMPQHFKSGAARKYHYVPRTKRYSIRKNRYAPRPAPLSYTGAMAKQVAGRIKIKRSDTKKKAKVRGTMWANVFAFLRRRGSEMPDLRAELTIINNTERVDMARFMKRYTTAQFRNNRRRQTITVGK